MDLQTVKELKETLSIAYQLCNNIESSGCWPYSDKMPMAAMLKYELVAFCRQLAAADYNFSLDERGFIRVIFDGNGAELADQITPNGTNLPVIISVSPQIAQLEAQKGVSHTNGVSVAQVMLMTFEMIGKAFIIAGGNDSREIGVYNNYVKLMSDFVKAL